MTSVQTPVSPWRKPCGYHGCSTPLVISKANTLPPKPTARCRRPTRRRFPAADPNHQPPFTGEPTASAVQTPPIVNAFRQQRMRTRPQPNRQLAVAVWPDRNVGRTAEPQDAVIPRIVVPKNVIRHLRWTQKHPVSLVPSRPPGPLGGSLGHSICNSCRPDAR